MTDRSKVLGGTDIAAIAGASPYKTAVDVFLEKTGRSPPPAKLDSRKDWGNRLEDLVLDRYEEDAGLAERIHRNRLADGSQEFIAHRDHPQIGGHLDAWSHVPLRVVDAKTTAMRDRWSNGPPDEVVVQVAVYMELIEAPRADIPTLFDGRDFRTFAVERDPVFGGNLIELAARFLRDHVLADKAPDPQTWEERQQLVRSLYPADRAPMKPSTLKIDALVDQFAEARRQIEMNENLEGMAKSLIEEFIADAEGVAGDWGRILWRRAKDTLVVDWEAIARSLSGRQTASGFEKLIAEHTTTRAGSRRFNFKPRKGNDE